MLDRIESDHTILNELMDVIPFLYKLFDEDVSIAVTDTEKYLFNHGVGTMNIPGGIGGPVPAGGAAHIALTENKSASRDVPATVYGVPFRSYAVPITEGNRLVGCMMLARDISRSHTLKDTSSALKDNLGEILNVITAMAESVQEHVATNATISDKVAKTVETTERTGEILKFIEAISSKTKLLGLNASIEAARAGEAGKGFAVVASEIQKMSISTNESVSKISSMLIELKSSNSDVQKRIEDSNSSFAEQAAAIEQIVASLNELDSAVSKLDALAKNI